MMRRRRIALWFVVAASALAGCMYPKSAEPPAPLTAAEIGSLKARFPEATEASLTEGRDVFVANCGKCHEHADVMRIEDSKWPEIVKEMGDKANLDKAEMDSLLNYILAVRAARKSAPAAK